jgi:hypothetical protein
MTLKQLYQSITRQEWKKVFLWSIIIIFITTLPIAYGYFNTPDGRALSGLHALTPIDMNVYYSYLEQVKQGRYIFVDLFADNKQNPLIFNIFWLGAGFLGKIFNLNNILTFQLTRIILIFIFTFVIYLFISYFFVNKTKRQTTLIFILFSSGIGAILAPVLEKFVFEGYGYYHWPLDLWVPEAITFLTLFHMPHFIASLILIILIFLFVLLSWENNHPLSGGDKRGLRYEIYAGLCALILSQFHPFHLPTVFGVLSGYFAYLCFVNRKILWLKLRPLLILFLFTIPNLIYHFYILNDPIIRQRALQNVCLTPIWWLTLVGFGFLVPLAIVGVYFIFTNQSDEKSGEINKYHFLIIWLIIQTLLIYSPNPLQRRMSEGLHIVLSLLAVIALFALSQKKNSPTKMGKMIAYFYKNKIFLTIIFIVFFTFSNFFNIARDILFYYQENIYLYLPTAKQQAFSWIKNNTVNNSIFLAHPNTNNFIAGNTGRFVYAGHTTETPFYEVKANQTRWFFEGNTGDEKKRDFLKQNNIDYIYYSDWEKFYSKNKRQFNPSEKNYLKLVYNNDLVQIYKVR